jgi:hypothetical protein
MSQPAAGPGGTLYLCAYLPADVGCGQLPEHGCAHGGVSASVPAMVSRVRCCALARSSW